MKVVLHNGEGTLRVLAGEAKRISVGLGTAKLENTVRIFDDETLQEIARQVPGRGWSISRKHVLSRQRFHYCDVEG